MGRKTLPYMLCCIGIYLLLAGVELFLMDPLIDFIGTDDQTHFIAELVLLLIANPIIVKLITDRIPFLRIKDGEEI